MLAMHDVPEQREVEAALQVFRMMTFDEGLVIRDAQIAHTPDGPILLVWFEDRRGSRDATLAAWWDFASGLESPPDPENLASFAKILLEEIFHAGGRLEDRPTDDHGTRWAEMDWNGRRGHRLPPVTSPGAS
jgi:hypothetical protein